MDSAKIKPGKPAAIPTLFRGLRILLLDNDASSMSDIASKLEDYSYRVTTTEVPTITLSILRERIDEFDLIMADINTPELDCFKFIKSVHDLKNLPIILTSAELKKDMVEEAMKKGACFFLKKPISSKNLKNVWQHVYKNNKNDKSKTEIKQEDTSPGPKNEQSGDSEEKEISKKRSVLPENDQAGKKLKRKRREEEGIKSSKKVNRLSAKSGDVHMQVDSTTFMKLLQKADTINESNLSEDSHLQTKFSTRKKQNMDLVKELGSENNKFQM